MSPSLTSIWKQSSNYKLKLFSLVSQLFLNYFERVGSVKCDPLPLPLLEAKLYIGNFNFMEENWKLYIYYWCTLYKNNFAMEIGSVLPLKPCRVLLRSYRSSRCS